MVTALKMSVPLSEAVVPVSSLHLACGLENYGIFEIGLEILTSPVWSQVTQLQSTTDLHLDLNCARASKFSIEFNIHDA